MKLHRVLVPMTDVERAALVADAQKSMRDPRLHARFILSRVLLGESPPSVSTNEKSDAKASVGRAALIEINS